MIFCGCEVVLMDSHSLCMSITQLVNTGGCIKSCTSVKFYIHVTCTDHNSILTDKSFCIKLINNSHNGGTSLIFAVIVWIMILSSGEKKRSLKRSFCCEFGGIITLVYLKKSNIVDQMAIITKLLSRYLKLLFICSLIQILLSWAMNTKAHILMYTVQLKQSNSHTHVELVQYLHKMVN